MPESADLEIETADSSADSNADSAKVGVWVRAFRIIWLLDTIPGP